jgi:hypothetical protein
MDGPDSPRKGICAALGFHESTCDDTLRVHIDTLMLTLRQRGLPVDYMYLETVACAFKNLKLGKRYVGYYLDRMYKEIKQGEERMKAISTGVNWDTLWEMRREIFPHAYLKEMNENNKELPASD